MPHERLLKKIWAYGIQGKLYSWLKDFLYSRQQRVTVGGECSNWAPVTSGVPQGSVLGPILFLIYINDIPDAMSCVVRLFADDTKLYKTIQTEQDQQQLQDDIFEASNWSKKWQLLFNVKKCKYMQIGNKPSENVYYIKDHQNKISEIQEVSQEKDLGVLFDPKLSFNSHVNEKVKKANRQVN